MLPHPNARMGLFLDNPMRKDVEEIGSMIGVDYALNVVLNDQKEITAAFWGDPFQIMQQGIPVSLEACQLDIKQSECGFDLVIASAGGFPKDINLYQSQKALTNACLFSRPGGVIILAAACRDGAGNEKFLQFLRGKTSVEQILNDFTGQPFTIGPHKAYQIALQAREHKIILVSDLPDGLMPEFLLRPAGNMQEALEIARTLLPENPRAALLPFATHSMPQIGK
jgi:nickel-dependent lactate racemase